MDPFTLNFTLLFSLLTCALPLLIGFLSGRSSPALPPALTVIGGIAVGLTLFGLLLDVAGMGAPGYAGLGYFVLGFVLTTVSFLFACFGGGLALGTAQRVGQQAWFVVVLFTAFFPLVGALAIFLLVIARAIFFSALPLAPVFALIGAGAVLAYGVLGQRAARPNV
jgi:hypothetical protein